MSETLAPRVLLAAPKRPKPPAPTLIVSVARQYGISPIAQFLQMMRLRFGQHRLDFHEYYSNQIYRPEISADERREFVGGKGNLKLNERLSPSSLTKPFREFVRDKVLYGASIAHLGFRTTETQAVVSRNRGYGNIPTLRSTPEIEDFLLNAARYPLFAKPKVGSGSIGSALIVDIDRDARELQLLNGAHVDLRAFATETLKDYAEGLIFQTALRQHRTLSEVAGRAVGTIRVVTVIENVQPRALYTLWKIPAPSAMSDNYWQAGSMVAEIDIGTGRLVQCRRGIGPNQESLDSHPVSGKAFAEVQIPFWQEVIEITTKAHLLLPQFGVFGWDVAITEDGPTIVECNSNPHHMLYQLATGRGVLNREFSPVLDRVAARAASLTGTGRGKSKAKAKVA